MTGTEMSTGSSAVKNNRLSQLPLKHPFITLVLRVPEMEIPLSALSISFCQQAGKEGKKKIKTWLGSLFHEENKPPASYRYTWHAFCVPSINIPSLRAQSRWMAGGTRAQLPCFSPWSWPEPLLLRGRVAELPRVYHFPNQLPYGNKPNAHSKGCCSFLIRGGWRQIFHFMT